MGRAVRALMALVVGVLALTGCAGQNPTHAATVNGVAITEQRVDEIAQGLAKAAGKPDAPGDQRNLAASILIRNEVGRQLGAQQGITITDADRAKVLEQSEQIAQLAAEPALTSFMNDYINSELVRAQIGEEKYTSAIESVPVTLNPRYGVWDAAKGMLTGESGSLSVPASSLTES